MLVTTALLLGAYLSAPETAAEKPADHATGPVRHIVLYGFKDSTTAEDKKIVEDAFRALPGKIDVVQDFEWGTNNSPEGLSDGYSHAFMLTFEDAAARDAYLPHPAHKAFAQTAGKYRDKVTVIDFVPQVVVPTPPRSADAAPIRHVVLFKFKEGTKPEDLKKVEDAFVALPSKIDTIEGFEWGTNVSAEGKSDGFTHCYVLSFADEAGRDAYLPHPAHKDFGKILGPYLDKVRVVDYKAQE